MKVLLIDDSKSVLAALDLALSGIPGLETTSMDDPAEALQLCRCMIFDLVLVDYTMPQMTGVEFIGALRTLSNYEHVPVVMVTSQRERAIRLAALEAGATEFLSKPFDGAELKARVVNLLNLRKFQLDLSGQADMLKRLVDNATSKLAAREEEIIWRLARAIEFRDGCTGDHISRVAQLAALLGEEMGLNEARCRMIYLATPLHDVGKIGIADGILTKPGRLTPEELKEMRRHVEIGVRILENGSSELLQIAERIAAGHHEKWDGTGYPRGDQGQFDPDRSPHRGDCRCLRGPVQRSPLQEGLDAFGRPRPYFLRGRPSLRPRWRGRLHAPVVRYRNADARRDGPRSARRAVGGRLSDPAGPSIHQDMIRPPSTLMVCPVI